MGKQNKTNTYLKQLWKHLEFNYQSNPVNRLKATAWPVDSSNAMGVTKPSEK